MTPGKLPIRFRKATVEDAPFILNSWLKSFRNSPFAQSIPNAVYFNEHHKILEKLLVECITIIACNKDDPSHIYGYINGGKIDGVLAINYIYVKQSFRNLGIGQELLKLIKPDKESAALYTHHTKAAVKMSTRYSLIYHPYALNLKFTTGSEPSEESEDGE